MNEQNIKVIKSCTRHAHAHAHFFAHPGSSERTHFCQVWSVWSFLALLRKITTTFLCNKCKKVESTEKLFSCRCGIFSCDKHRHLHANLRAHHVAFDLYVTFHARTCFPIIHACLHRKVIGVFLDCSKNSETVQMQKVETSRVSRTFFAHAHFCHTRFSKSENPKIPKIDVFVFFENHNFSNFCSLSRVFIKMCGPVQVWHARTLFSISPVTLPPYSPKISNSRVKKPQITGTSCDTPTRHLWRAWRVTRAQTCAREKIRGCDMKMGVCKIWGFRKTEGNQGPNTGNRKTPKTRKSSFDKPLLLSSSIFRFFILPKCHPKWLFFGTEKPHLSRTPPRKT